MQAPPQFDVEPVPPVERWGTWYDREHRDFKQGMHLLISGPTGSGKTVLCRHVVRIRPYVVVLGTKPKDESLDAYEEEGYLRIDHWPPTRSERREFDGLGEGRFLVWPEMHTREDLRRHRDLYLKVMDDIYAEGHWTLVIDETLWIVNKQRGLDLGEPLSDLAFGVRSNKGTLVMLTQRSIVPGEPIIWMNVSQVLAFKQGRADDIREAATLSTYDPVDVARALKHLGPYQFLDLPVRAQAPWSISKVPASWA